MLLNMIIRFNHDENPPSTRRPYSIMPKKKAKAIIKSIRTNLCLFTPDGQCLFVVSGTIFGFDFDVA